MVQLTDNAGHLLFESDGVTPLTIPPYPTVSVMGVGGAPFRQPFGPFFSKIARVVAKYTVMGVQGAPFRAPFGAFDLRIRAITDTTRIQKPVNCVMMGNQPLKVAMTEIDSRQPQWRTQATVTTEGVKKLSGGPSTFTVKTSKRGYD